MLILYNAKIYTMDPDLPTASAAAVDDYWTSQGRFLAVGDERKLLAYFSEQDDLHFYNAEGRAVIPGLIDSHLHLELYALSLLKVNCETEEREECLRRVADRARMTARGEWILGHGWNHNNWVEGFGQAADLDAVSPEHPVYLTAKSLHAGWANSTALRLAGITAQMPDPAGGKLGRDKAGNPNGILFEAAMNLMAAAIPEPSLDQVSRAIRSALKGLWQMGLTGGHDFDRKRCFAALQQLRARDELHFRVVKSLPFEELPQAAALGLRTGFGDDYLRIGSIKAFADGALGPQSAAMLQPFEGQPENRGMLLIDGEELYERGRLAVENGLSLAVHAIGDRANHEVLDGFAQLRQYEQDLKATRSPEQPTLRHRIEHVQLIHPEDAGRLAQLDVIASMQPIHAPSDMLMADRHWGKRAALSYAWRTQLDQGARLAFGSDAPVESPNPFWGLHAAVTRRRLEGAPGPLGWYPEQRLTVGEALRAYTLGAAYAGGMEDRLGKIATGYLADLLVLNRDPFTCDPDELKTIHPIATMIGGDWVWQS